MSRFKDRAQRFVKPLTDRLSYANTKYNLKQLTALTPLALMGLGGTQDITVRLANEYTSLPISQHDTRLILTNNPADPTDTQAYIQEIQGTTNDQGEYIFTQVATPNEHEATLPSTFETYAAFPNPAQGDVTVPFDAVVPGNITVRTFNNLGQQLMQYEEFAGAGSNQVEFGLAGQAAGPIHYMLQHADGSMRTGSFIYLGGGQDQGMDINGSGARQNSFEKPGAFADVARKGGNGPEWILYSPAQKGFDAINHLFTTFAPGQFDIEGRPTPLAVTTVPFVGVEDETFVYDALAGEAGNVASADSANVLGATYLGNGKFEITPPKDKNGAWNFTVQRFNKLGASGEGNANGTLEEMADINAHIGRVNGTRPATRNKEDLYEILEGARLVVTDKNNNYLTEAHTDTEGNVNAQVIPGTTVKLYVFDDSTIPRLHEIYVVGTGFISDWKMNTDQDFEVYAAAAELPEAWLFRHTFSNGLRPLSRPDPALYPDGVLPARIGPGDQIGEDSLIFREMLQVANEQYAEPMYTFVETDEDQAYTTTTYDKNYTLAGSTNYTSSNLNNILRTNITYFWPLGTGQTGKIVTTKEIAQTAARSTDFKGNISGDEQVNSETEELYQSMWNLSNTSQRDAMFDVNTNTINQFDVKVKRWELKTGLLQEGYSVTDKDAELNINWPAGKTAPNTSSTANVTPVYNYVKN